MSLVIETGDGCHNLEDNDWMQHVVCYLRVGRNWIRVPELESSLYWHTRCEVTEPHPLLDLVTELYIIPYGGRICLGDPEVFSIDLFRNIEHVNIQDAYHSDALWQQYGVQDFLQLGKWMASRVEAGKRVQALEIDGKCHDEVKQAAATLAHLGLCENVYWDD